ncbi:hypothetical protein [Usitatibacter palustris]|uniref:DUF5648 domain-containing protein n=1 Tax=Usitatibacter palustris TaxID=2732487 RepID=A0A6M4H9S5_9PROT|nr:hypothetical protein [Usitatibacter palustris]QJR15935.1 hypothetical protein DSM104440_02762 [Usitatibacter palustris]
MNSNKLLAVALASLGATLVPVATVTAGSGPTEICNANPSFSSSITLRYNVPANDPRIERMVAAGRDPKFDPALYERMGAPKQVLVLQINGTNVMILDYALIQDPEEMAARIRADAELAAPFNLVGANGTFCDGVPAAAPTVGVREYYNSKINHFYMSSNPDEMAWLDAGGGGGGWVHTGEAWTTHMDSAPNCYTPNYSPVYLFYGTPGIGPNSHYYTTNPAECGYLRNTTGWTYLTTPFGAQRTNNGACTLEAPVGLMLLYNNRAAQNDSNHRYTSSQAIYQSMLAQGWIGYGVQLCVKANGAP